MDPYPSDGALFSKDRKYRYSLWRNLPKGDKGPVLFIMLNPSTADEKKNDPTVTRCINYAIKWGHGLLYVGNIFAYRATDPKRLKKVMDPIGGDKNNFYLSAMASKSDLVVAAWGTHGGLNDRGYYVRTMLAREHKIPCHALRLTKGGYPSHPLYLPGKLKPKKWLERVN